MITFIRMLIYPFRTKNALTCIYSDNEYNNGPSVVPREPLKMMTTPRISKDQDLWT